MFIGEAPGADEDQAGRPFAGGAGRILTTWCYQADIQRDSCYLDNVVQHRPPENDIDRADVAGEVAGLFRRIIRVNPRLVVLLGNTALRVFVDGNIGDWRGSYFPITIAGRVFKAVATLHPAYIMRQRRMWDICVADLKKAKRLSNVPGPYQETTQRYNEDPSPTELQQFVEECCDDPDTNLTVDIETDMQGRAVDLVGLGRRPGEALVTSLDDDQSMRQMLRLFRRVRTVTTQNGWAFDIPKLRDVGLPARSPRHDTLLYSHLLHPHLPKSLAFLISVYTDFSYHKDQADVRKKWYCCRDVDTTQIIVRHQLQELEELGLSRLATNVMRYAGVVMHMRVHGMKIDRQGMARLQMEKLAEESKHTLTMQNITGDKFFNPLSPKQVEEVWTKKLGLPMPYNRKQRKYNLDKEMVKKQLEKYRMEGNQKVVQFLEGLVSTRSSRKLASTYYSCEVDEWQRIHPNWKMASQAGEEDEDLK
jgi:DNA polymerase